VNLTALHGALSVPDSDYYGVAVAFGVATANNTVSLTGTLDNVNLALKTLTYTPPANYYGPEYVSVFVNDRAFGQNGLTHNETIPIVVDAVTDVPTLNIPHDLKVLQLLEDTNVALRGVTVSDPDFVEAADGAPTYSRDQGNEFTSTYNGSNHSAVLEIMDQRYPFVKLYNKWDKTVVRAQQGGVLRLTVACSHGSVMITTRRGLSFISTPNVTLETIRLSSVPAIYQGLDSKLTYGGVGESDNIGGDASGAPQQLWWKLLTMEGHLYDINRALGTLVYRPDQNWNSGTVQTESSRFDSTQGIELDTVQFLVENIRQSNTQNFDEVPLTYSSEKVQVRVHPKNDAPVLSMPGAILDTQILTEDTIQPAVVDTLTQYCEEDTPLSISGISIRDIDVSEDAFVKVTLTAEHGTVQVRSEDIIANASLVGLPGSVGLLYEEGSPGGIGSTEISFLTSIKIANEALEVVTFFPETNYYGDHGKVTVTVDDLGNTGLGGNKSDTQSIRIYVQPRNDMATILTPADSGGKSIFIVDESEFIRIDGAKFDYENPLEVDARVNAGNTWRSGFELWRLEEPDISSDRAKGSTTVGARVASGYEALNVHGAGSLSWDKRQVSDIQTGSGSSNPRFFTEYNGALYFQADDGVHGAELWRDMGSLQNPIDTKKQDSSAFTESGMSREHNANMFADLVPGHLGSSPAYLMVHNGYMFFGSAGIDNSWMVLPSKRDKCASFRQSTFDQKVFFAVSDSDVWNPQRVYDCPVGYHWASTEEGHRHFTSYQLETENRQWNSQGGAEAQQRIGQQLYSQKSDGEYEFATSIASASSESYEEKVYFDQCGWVGYDYGGYTRVHFRFSDSHLTSEYKHAGKPDSYRPDRDTLDMTGSLLTAQFAGIVCIAGEDTSCKGEDCRKHAAGNELWRTDGTNQGTMRIDDIFAGPTGSNPSDLISFGTWLYFAAETRADGRELWRTEGTDYSKAQLVSVHGSSTGIWPGLGNSNP
jgi:ELWxxDGT repeat protein